MKNFIIKLQDQPLAVRKQILIVGTFGITFLIVLIWIFTFTYSKNTKKSISSNSIAKPFQLLKDNVVQVYANAQKGFDEAKNSLGNNK